VKARCVAAFVLSLLLAASPAWADLKALQDLLLERFIESGFKEARAKTTLLGRGLVIGIHPNGWRRRIVFHPRTGQILRDTIISPDGDWMPTHSARQKGISEGTWVPPAKTLRQIAKGQVAPRKDRVPKAGDKPPKFAPVMTEDGVFLVQEEPAPEKETPQVTESTASDSEKPAPPNETEISKPAAPSPNSGGADSIFRQGFQAE